MSRSVLVKEIQKGFQAVCKTDAFDRIGHKVKFLEANEGSLTAEMKVGKEDCNPIGIMHGGMSAYLVDCIGTVVQMAHPKTDRSASAHGGVTSNINLVYLKGVPEGQEILIKAYADRVGKHLSFLRVDILNKKTGEIAVQGSLTKFISSKKSSK